MPLLQSGQTLLFLGDHTSPDHPGYVAVMRDVLQRFHPKLQVNLISAGSRGQTAAGLRSSTLLNLITSSKPDWLIVGIGLADAFKEPSAQAALRQIDDERSQQQLEDAEATFGPELRPRLDNRGPVNDIGTDRSAEVKRLAPFHQDMATAIKQYREAGINVAVLTTALLGTDPQWTMNRVLRVYNQSIRAATLESGALTVDVEKAFRDVLDRATTYKQRVALAAPTGEANAQGQALLARTVLGALDMLPQPGWRPLR